MKTLLLSAMLALVPAAAGAATVKAGDLTIENAWARATPKGSPVAAGYMTIENSGSTPDKLTGVSVDFANVSIHEMKMTDGVMEMREVSGGLEIPAHGQVSLAPSGYHLMFMNLKHPLTKGETVKATLRFEHGGQVLVNMPVLPIGAGAPPNGQTMKGMKP